MAQLALFEGPHVPRTAARAALARCDLTEAHAQLEQVAGSEERADAARLEQIASTLGATGGDPVETVHGAFAAALEKRSPRGFLSDAEWLGVYARQLAASLAPEPGLRFRGWLGAHFAFASRDADAVRCASRRIVESLAPGPPWLEAARLEFEHGDAAQARRWVHAACLASATELDAAPPALERCGVVALDATLALPRLPPQVEDLFDAARALEDLPGPRTPWIAVMGEIDRVLVPMPESEDERVEGWPDRDAHGDPARAFLAALRAARRSRDRDRDRGPERCSDRELRARRRMQRLAPALLARYVQGLRGALL